MQKIQIPEYLDEGDKVYILSTARAVSREEIEPALNIIKNWGLQAIIGKTIGARHNQFAGEMRFRESDLQNALDHDQVKAIWCAKGGYGTVQLIDSLDFSKFEKNPKWILGYSDVTTLHSYMHDRGFATLHGPILLGLETKADQSVQSVRDALFGMPLINKIPNKQKLPDQRIIAPIVGGNLSILYSLCGSPSAIDTTGKILFLEDLDEYLYHIDRMMRNLDRNGMLENLAALIIGGMTEMNDNPIPYGSSAMETIREVCSKYDYPIIEEFPAGHIPDNRTIKMGCPMTIEIAKEEISFMQ